MFSKAFSRTARAKLSQISSRPSPRQILIQFHPYITAIYPHRLPSISDSLYNYSISIHERSGVVTCIFRRLRFLGYFEERPPLYHQILYHQLLSLLSIGVGKHRTVFDDERDRGGDLRILGNKTYGVLRRSDSVSRFTFRIRRSRRFFLIIKRWRFHNTMLQATATGIGCQRI